MPARPKKHRDMGCAWMVTGLKAMPHGSDFYNEFAKIPEIYEKSYRAMEFSTKLL